MGRSLGYATLQIMKAMAAGATFGFEIMRETGLPSGTVYPTLRRLEGAGLVRSSWEDADVVQREARPRRRYLRLTGAGEAALAEGLERMRELARGSARVRLRPVEG